MILQSEKLLYVVTERVVPLSAWLEDNRAEAAGTHLAVSWGLHQIIVSN